MIVHVTTSPGAAPQVGLLEPADFKAFKVVLAGDGDRASGLEAAGRVEGEHVFVAPERLRELAGPAAGDPEWSAQLDGMVAYAAAHGWTDDAGRVRAHVE